MAAKGIRVKWPAKKKATAVNKPSRERVLTLALGVVAGTVDNLTLEDRAILGVECKCVSDMYKGDGDQWYRGWNTSDDGMKHEHKLTPMEVKAAAVKVLVDLLKGSK